jgi:hypothetical protein
LPAKEEFIRSLLLAMTERFPPVLIWNERWDRLSFAPRVSVAHLEEDVMSTLKSLTIVAVLLVGGTSLAMAQNGLPTGGERPVAGGANGGGPYYGHVYRYGYGYRPYRHLYGYYPHYRHYSYRHY